LVLLPPHSWLPPLSGSPLPQYWYVPELGLGMVGSLQEKEGNTLGTYRPDQ
jgi:hypothetical protein